MSETSVDRMAAATPEELTAIGTLSARISEVWAGIIAAEKER